jgi:hypothetical protein
MASTDEFLKQYSEALRNGEAALFVGAGVSRGAGFVDWKGLLKEIAEDLGLDIDRESDLVALAQYHENDKGRHRLNTMILNEFNEDATQTDTLKLLATLPVNSVWTTNYDQLLEEAFQGAEKRIDVKRTDTSLSVTRRRTDVTIYKMHGDITNPDTAVITKSDYETYHSSHPLFTIALKGDLTRKTFLFIGFSFTDPNITYIHSRVHQLLEKNARNHYCIIKRPTPAVDGDYACTRFNHWLGDLKRYHIEPVLIDNYDEIPVLLKELNRRSHSRNIFVSGSAYDFDPMGKDKFEALCRLLGDQLIKEEYNVVSGFGLGVGGNIILGASGNLRRNNDDRLRLWPFPQAAPPGMNLGQIWTQYRERMIEETGVCVVLAGNKFDAATNIVVPPNGVREEVAIAMREGKTVIPIGATGHVARELWDDAQADPAKYFGTLDFTNEMQILGDAASFPEQLVKTVVQMLKKLEKKGP